MKEYKAEIIAKDCMLVKKLYEIAIDFIKDSNFKFYLLYSSLDKSGNGIKYCDSIFNLFEKNQEDKYLNKDHIQELAKICVRSDKYNKSLNYVIENCKDLNLNDLLIDASFLGEIENVKTLLLQGANINYQDSEGSTALIKSIKTYHPEVSELLIAKGAKTHIQDPQGRTALHYSRLTEADKVSTLLLKTNLKLNSIKNNHGDTPSKDVINSIKAGWKPSLSKEKYKFKDEFAGELHENLTKSIIYFFKGLKDNSPNLIQESRNILVKALKTKDIQDDLKNCYISHLQGISFLFIDNKDKEIIDLIVNRLEEQKNWPWVVRFYYNMCLKYIVVTDPATSIDYSYLALKNYKKYSLNDTNLLESIYKEMGFAYSVFDKERSEYYLSMAKNTLKIPEFVIFRICQNPELIASLKNDKKSKSINDIKTLVLILQKINDGADINQTLKDHEFDKFNEQELLKREDLNHYKIYKKIQASIALAKNDFSSYIQYLEDAHNNISEDYIMTSSELLLGMIRLKLWEKASEAFEIIDKKVKTGYPKNTIPDYICAEFLLKVIKNDQEGAMKSISKLIEYSKYGKIPQNLASISIGFLLNSTIQNCKFEAAETQLEKYKSFFNTYKMQGTLLKYEACIKEAKEENDLEKIRLEQEKIDQEIKSYKSPKETHDHYHKMKEKYKKLENKLISQAYSIIKLKVDSFSTPLGDYLEYDSYVVKISDNEYRAISHKIQNNKHFEEALSKKAARKLALPNNYR